jgi:hypothetical protein
MSKASRQLDTDRAARNRARRIFDSRLAMTRQDMTPSAIANRVAGQLERQAVDTFDEMVEIADENRAVVAGTLAALAIWFLRKPIISLLSGKLRDDGQAEDIADDGF